MGVLLGQLDTPSQLLRPLSVAPFKGKGPHHATLLSVSRVWSPVAPPLPPLALMSSGNLLYICVCLALFACQYTLFLLYASFVHSARLEELLLARCESSVQVAHSLYWFLKAFCVQGAGVTPVGVKAIEQVNVS